MNKHTVNILWILSAISILPFFGFLYHLFFEFRLLDPEDALDSPLLALIGYASSYFFFWKGKQIKQKEAEKPVARLVSILFAIVTVLTLFLILLIFLIYFSL